MDPHIYLVERRVDAIRKQLLAGFAAADGLSSATRGTEREQFVNGFLEQVFPTPFRFGTGDIVEKGRRRSGQVDIVVEYPFIPSFPALGAGPRLYLAEGAAAVIEVKSNLRNQKNEVIKTATKVKELRVVEDAIQRIGHPLCYGTIPVLATGFYGWKQPRGIKKLLGDDLVDAALQLEPPAFIRRAGVFGDEPELFVEGSAAAVMFIDTLRRALTSVTMIHSDLRLYSTPASLPGRAGLGHDPAKRSRDPVGGLS